MLCCVSTPGEPGTVSGADDNRLQRIESATDAALVHLGVEVLLTELLHRVREVLQVDTEAYSGPCYRSCKTGLELRRSVVDQDR